MKVFNNLDGFLLMQHQNFVAWINNFSEMDNFKLARMCIGIAASLILIDLIFIVILQSRGVRFQFTGVHIAMGVLCVAAVSCAGIAYSNWVQKKVCEGKRIRMNDDRTYIRVSLRLLVFGLSTVQIIQCIAILVHVMYIDIPTIFDRLAVDFIVISTMPLCMSVTSFFYFLWCIKTY